MSPSRLVLGIKTWLIALLLATLGGAPARAEVAAPKPPAEYKAVVRYRIQAARNERVAQFFEMTRFLESLGFKKDAGPDNEPEDTNLTRVTGTISSAKAAQLLQEPHVRAVLLIPTDFEVPADPDKPVKVRLELERVLSPERQALLEDQVRSRLEELG